VIRRGGHSTNPTAIITSEDPDVLGLQGVQYLLWKAELQCTLGKPTEIPEVDLEDSTLHLNVNGLETWFPIGHSAAAGSIQESDHTSIIFLLLFF